MWERLSNPARARRRHFFAQPPRRHSKWSRRTRTATCRATLAGWTAGGDLASFLPAALDAHEMANAKPSVIAAGCADYCFSQSFHHRFNRPCSGLVDCL
jgi:hypothetical protein